jgi:hypothetical protein
MTLCELIRKNFCGENIDSAGFPPKPVPDAPSTPRELRLKDAPKELMVFAPACVYGRHIHHQPERFVDILLPG